MSDLLVDLRLLAGIAEAGNCAALNPQYIRRKCLEAANKIERLQAIVEKVAQRWDELKGAVPHPPETGAAMLDISIFREAAEEAKK